MKSTTQNPGLLGLPLPSVHFDPQHSANVALSKLTDAQLEVRLDRMREFFGYLCKAGTPLSEWQKYADGAQRVEDAINQAIVSRWLSAREKARWRAQRRREDEKAGVRL